MPNRCCFVPNCKAGYPGFKPCENWEGIPMMILPYTTHGCHLNLKTVQFLQLGFGFTQMMGLRSQFVLNSNSSQGKLFQSKSVHLKGKSVFWSCNSKVLYSMELNPEDTNETLVQQITRIAKEFDQAHTCKGVREEKLSNIKFCAGAVLHLEINPLSTRFLS
uniref:Uncharacterized protein n=1 Tax=Daphnia galeata TaxID=27404 RepID=A0A8J2RM45_9CRUS|nr:unnamed protein product [Daphnia galeata]